MKKFDFTPVLGWSASRYDTFSTCKRQYFYQYYGKYDPKHSRNEVDRLKNLTSIPLETGSMVHDIIKAVLQRLQKSETDIDTTRFRDFVQRETEKQCKQKTFIEVYYKEREAVSASDLLPKIEECLNNCLYSKRYRWIADTAIATKEDWVVEPPGYGEARLDGLKVYCKVDFLFPVEDRIIIVDWKTGKRDQHKHNKQLTGYAAWAAYHLDRRAEDITTIIAYLYPEYAEIEVSPTDNDLRSLRDQIQRETDEMYALCGDAAENVPLDIGSFPMTDSSKVQVLQLPGILWKIISNQRVERTLGLKEVDMEIIGWLLWVLALLWTSVSFVSFLVDAFNPNPAVQPTGAVLSVNIKRAVGFAYVLGMSAALWVTAVGGVSKFHLLWFVPVFHFLGTTWIPMLFSGVHTPASGQPVPIKDYSGPESSLKAFPLLYVYFDDFAELSEMSRSGRLQIGLHANDPRSCAFTQEQVFSDENLFLRLYGDNLLRVRLSDGFEMFRSVEEDYWDRASHPEKYAAEMSSPDARMRELFEQINVHVTAIRMRYGFGQRPSDSTERV